MARRPCPNRNQLHSHEYAGVLRDMYECRPIPSKLDRSEPPAADGQPVSEEGDTL
jgi:hypothetical protein